MMCLNKKRDRFFRHMINRINMILGVGGSGWRAECKSSVPQVVHNPLNPVNPVNDVSKQKGTTGFSDT